MRWSPIATRVCPSQLLGLISPYSPCPPDPVITPSPVCSPHVPLMIALPFLCTGAHKVLLCPTASTCTSMYVSVTSAGDFLPLWSAPNVPRAHCGTVPQLPSGTLLDTHPCWLQISLPSVFLEPLPSKLRAHKFFSLSVLLGNSHKTPKPLCTPLSFYGGDTLCGLFF